LKHSYLDVLKPTSPPQLGQDLVLQSLADETRLILPGGEFVKDLATDRPLLTRVIHDPKTQEPDRAVWAGCGITVSQADAEALLDITSEWRREMEVTTGSFALGEWKEFAKRFGYMILWAFAQRRMDALVDAVIHIGYRNPDGQPYLYAVALYDHHEHSFFTEILSEMNDFHVEKQVSDDRQSAAGDRPSVQKWVQREDGRLVARLTLTVFSSSWSATTSSGWTTSSIGSRPRWDFHCISEARRWYRRSGNYRWTNSCPMNLRRWS
jgi:hypothetical protein